MSKRRWLTRCRKRAAAGPTQYLLYVDDLSVIVPRKVLLLAQTNPVFGRELSRSIQTLADNYRKVLGL